MNKKKWGGNSKIFSTIILLFVGCCFMATSSWAARKVDFYSANAASFIEKLNQNESSESETIGPILGLSQDEAFTLLRQKTDFNGVTHYRYQQTYKGIPVWGIQTIISRGPSNQVVRLHGAMVLDIPGDIKNIPSSLDALGALNKMEDQHKKIDKNAQWTFRNEEYGIYIYLHKHKNRKAHLCYVVSFFADTECGNPSRPVFFVDVKTGKVIHSFDSLAYAYDGTGPGGNQKVGYYYYGTDYDPFCVAVNGSTCTMDCTDVKTVDLNHGTSGSTAYSYTCYENTHEEINGAYCPLNDAQYFGQVVFDTYMDWYGVPVLPFQLTLRCHYSTNYENHFWDGSTMTFGDGYTTFYPLVALDLIAHEASHGFTENHSNLTYSDQSGGINEAFSDIAGEGCEYYMRGTNDFMCGYDICQNPSGALRYLYDPPLDGISIDHVLDYYEGMNVNCSSGIFNKAFYLISTTPGWNTRMAFDIFTKANMDYWVPSSTFVQGADGVMNAAVDYGYSYQDVVNAFAQVGIGPPVAAFVGSPTCGVVPLTVNFTDQSINSPTSWSWNFGDGGTSPDQNPIHTYTSCGTYTVSLIANNACGSDTEVKTDYIKAYCASSGLNQDYEYIARVVVGDLDNPSGPSPYSDFTYLIAHLTPGETVNVSLTPGFTGPPYTENWKIWIDYDNDCYFDDTEDTDEAVFRGLGSTVLNGSFTVPCSNISGDTRMRVSMKYGSYPTPCETFTYGEVEDYTVDFTELDFIANETVLCEAGCVTFTLLSTDNIWSISWIFEGGIPPTSTAQNPTVCYNTPGTYDVTLIVTTPGGTCTKTKSDYITVLPADEIAEAVDYEDVCQIFIKSGDADWYRVTDIYVYDNDSARSGDIDDDQSTTIETTVTVDSTQAVKFYWKVSSEANYDYLRFYIDGVEKAKIAGEVNWTQVTYNVTAGTHTLKWSYTKDMYVSSGSDCGWVDNLELQ